MVNCERTSQFTTHNSQHTTHNSQLTIHNSQLVMEWINDIEKLKNQEYVVTNGIGGYCSSSVCGMNTRKYHGILVASLNPPVERYVTVSNIEETIVAQNGARWDISTHQYPGTFYPQGYKSQTGFSRLPIPTFTFENPEGLRIEKRICLVQGSNTVVISYKNNSNETFVLNANPLYVFRDYHSLNFESNVNDYDCETIADFISVKQRYFPTPVFSKMFSGAFKCYKSVYYNVELLQEQKRGFDLMENMFSAGSFSAEIEAGKTIYLTISLDKSMMEANPVSLMRDEISRIESIAKKEKDTYLKDLIVAGNQFIIDRKSTGHKSIIAGYHWFTDWGRDTMIAMRGLTIATGEKEIAESILTSFLANLSAGLLPNRFSDLGEAPEYNTADATLWMFVVLYEYYQKFNDFEFIDKHFDALWQIIDKHIAGTRYNIKVGDDGMLYSGAKGYQITWMDAKVGDYVVTPRIGYAVEINLLWYNALKIFEIFTDIKNKKGASLENAPDVRNHIEKFEKNFHAYFWNEGGFLNDVITGEKKIDASFRPNQVYATSLPFTVLSAAEIESVLDKVKEKLLTPLGLRSLSTDDSQFIGIYQGDSWHRDTAYHQGTVWSFLLPEFCLGWLKFHNFSKASVQDVKTWIKPLEEHFYNADGIHSISEIFDGLNPTDGKGCIHQAWSIGMMIKLLKTI